MIIYRLTKYNKSSISALMAALETDKYFDNKKNYLLSEFSSAKNLDLPKSEKTFFLYSFTTKEKEKVFSEIKKIKNIFNDAVIIAGGPHASCDPQDCIDNNIDFVICGEGEESLISLIKNLASTADIASKIIKGIPVDLNKYPAFPFKNPNMILYIEITRGCPFACSFCQTSRLAGIKPRHRSIKDILKHVEFMLKYKLDDIRFVSPNALSYGSIDGRTINYQALEGLLKTLDKTLEKRGKLFFGSFPSEIRPEFINKETISLLKKYCDNDNIIIGAQSGSDRILRLTGRQHTSADIEKAVLLAKKSGFKTNVDFIFGFPFENQEDIETTLKMMDRFVAQGIKIHAHKLIAFPGTKYYEGEKIKIHKDILNFLKKHVGKGLVYGRF